MKVIKNDSYTGMQIFIAVPDSALTTTVKNLAKRRVLKITNA